MNILIDYENVRMGGLQGSEYLDYSDKVYLFWSNGVPNISQWHYEQISLRPQSFDTIKLEQTGKNFLDMYMAVKVGEIIKETDDNIIAIISNDKGFQAIQHYCHASEKKNISVILASTIENAILNSPEDSERTRDLRKKKLRISIEEGNRKQKEQKEIYSRLAEVLRGTEYEEDLDTAFNILHDFSTPKQRYHEALHQKGLKKGTELYKILKIMS